MQTASQLHPIFYFSSRRSSIKSDGLMKLGGWNSSQLGFSGRGQSLRFLTPIRKTRLFVISNTDDGHAYAPVLEEDSNINHAPSSEPETFFSK